MQLRTFRFLEWVNLTNWMESVLKKWYIFQGRHWRQRLRDWGLAWILSRVWNFRKYNVASTLFFQGLDHIFSAYNFQFKRKEARLPLLILNNKKKSWPYFLHPIFCTPYFGPYFLLVANRPMFLKLEWWVQIDRATVVALSANNLPFVALYLVCTIKINFIQRKIKRKQNWNA